MSRRGRARAVLLGLALSASAARGQPTEPGSVPEVRLHVAADEQISTAVIRRLRPVVELLGGVLRDDVVTALDVDRVFDELGRPRPAAPLAEIWLDARVANGARLLLAPRIAERVLTRELALPDGFDEVALAELEYIVDRAVQTLLADEPLGVPREEARAALRAPAMPTSTTAVRAAPVAPPRRGRLALELGAFAGGQAWSGADPLLPAGGILALLENVTPSGRLGVALDAGLHAPVRATTSDARVSALGLELRLAFTLARAVGRAGLWRLLVGPGLFVTLVEATPAPTFRSVVTQTRSDVDLGVGALLRWDVAVLGHSVLFAAVGVDVVPAPGRYTGTVDGTTVLVLAPWPVRPRLAIGLAFDLLGPR